MGHVASAIAHGVFERWPNARLVLVECGIAWLPAILWRLDADYRALRKETPWLKRLPSEYAREHVRLTTQPLEQPRHRAALWPALEDVGADDMLLFASDYPHWDFDSPTVVPVPPAWREKVMRGNARALYGGALCEGPVGGTALPTEDRSYTYGREGEILRCAWHGWEFDIRTGQSLVDAAVRARTYSVAVVDGAVVIAV